MARNSNSRLTVAVTLLVLYLLPLVVLSAYLTNLLPLHERWNILTAGLLTTAFGTTILFLMMQRWERALQEERIVYQTAPVEIREEIPLPPAYEPPPKTSDELTVEAVGKEIQRLTELLQDKEEREGELTAQLEADQEDIQVLTQENAQLQEKVHRLEHSFSTLKQNLDHQLQEKESALQDALQTNADQRNTIDKRQKQIQALENTARDLKYELKTILDLTDRIHTPENIIADIEESVAFETPVAAPQPQRTERNEQQARQHASHDAVGQLKRCIDIAQKFTGARHLAEQPSRFQDLSVDGYALDLRRLCDSLRSETSITIVLYSQKDEKLLFVNNEVRNLLGWSPEKFVQDFPNLVTEGLEDWNKALRKAPTSSPCEVSVLIKTRAGDNKLVRCQLGIIPTGIFRAHIVGVLLAG